MVASLGRVALCPLRLQALERGGGRGGVGNLALSAPEVSGKDTPSSHPPVLSPESGPSPHLSSQRAPHSQLSPWQERGQDDPESPGLVPDQSHRAPGSDSVQPGHRRDGRLGRGEWWRHRDTLMKNMWHQAAVPSTRGHAEEAGTEWDRARDRAGAKAGKDLGTEGGTDWERSRDRGRDSWGRAWLCSLPQAWIICRGTTPELPLCPSSVLWWPSRACHTGPEGSAQVGLGVRAPREVWL